MKTIRSITTGAMVAGVLLTQPLCADDRDDRIRSLEKRVEQLEKMLLDQNTKPVAPTVAPKPAEKPETTVAPAPGPSVSIGADGFTMRSADDDFRLRFRGLLQIDSRWNLDGDNLDDKDGFLVRRARPILEGTVFGDFDFQFTPEFGGSSPTIRDAWLNYHYDGALKLRVGKMKPPGGLERWQSVANNPFIERSFPSLLWPVREVGMMLYGELWSGNGAITKTLAGDGLANYAIGVFNGTGDGQAAGNSDFDNGKSGAGRLFFHPFLQSGIQPLQRLGLGVSGSYGNLEGDDGLPDDLGYADDVVADGTQWRVGPQAYWYWGRFGLMGEYAISSQRIELQAPPFGSVRAENNAWSVTASWMLTGEDATFRVLTPRKSFDPRQGGWGAWQIVARYSYLDIDNDLFPIFADPTELPTSATTWGVGLNWFLNRNVRAALNFNHTDLKGGQNGSVADFGENALSTRLQLAF